MADVISLKDGSVETIFEPKDFKYLVEKHMGWDADKYFENLISELQEQADYTQAKVDTDLESYEASLESNTRCMNDILDDLKAMETILNAKRMDKQKLFNLIEQIETKINNQI